MPKLIKQVLLIYHLLNLTVCGLKSCNLDWALGILVAMGEAKEKHMHSIGKLQHSAVPGLNTKDRF